jgi:hypothetical protein
LIDLRHRCRPNKNTVTTASGITTFIILVPAGAPVPEIMLRMTMMMIAASTADA